MDDTAGRILGRANNAVHIALDAVEHDKLKEKTISLIKKLLTEAKQEHALLDKHLHQVRNLLQ
jgi:hypothetical protein